jgi:hypothetical protein
MSPPTTSLLGPNIPNIALSIFFPHVKTPYFTAVQSSLSPSAIFTCTLNISPRVSSWKENYYIQYCALVIKLFSPSINFTSILLLQKQD